MKTNHPPSSSVPSLEQLQHEMQIIHEQNELLVKHIKALNKKADTLQALLLTILDYLE